MEKTEALVELLSFTIIALLLAGSLFCGLTAGGLIWLFDQTDTKRRILGAVAALVCAPIGMTLFVWAATGLPGSVLG